MTVRPALVLAPGMFHGPAHFSPLIDYLSQHGYRCVTVEMPHSHPRNNVYPKDLDEDIGSIRDALVHELDDGRDVVLVMHSFSGVAGIAAPQDLDEKSRAAAGKATSVKAVAAIAAFIPSKGQSVLDILSGQSGESPDITGEVLPNGGFHVKSTPGPVHFFYQDLPKTEADKWAALLTPASNNGAFIPVPYAADVHIPTSYLICSMDNALYAGTQKRFVDAHRANGSTIRAEIIASSHSPFLSQIQTTGDFIRRAAGEETPSTLVPY